MASMLIRKIDERTKARLRVRAAEHGRSMEEEARAILSAAVRAKGAEKNLGKAIRSYFAPFGGFDIELPPREPMREPPDFSGPEYDR
jgi:antitoxin FitA